MRSTIFNKAPKVASILFLRTISVLDMIKHTCYENKGNDDQRYKGLDIKAHFPDWYHKTYMGNSEEHMHA